MAANIVLLLLCASFQLFFNRICAFPFTYRTINSAKPTSVLSMLTSFTRATQRRWHSSIGFQSICGVFVHFPCTMASLFSFTHHETPLRQSGSTRLVQSYRIGC